MINRYSCKAILNTIGFSQKRVKIFFKTNVPVKLKKKNTSKNKSVFSF